VSSLYNLLIRCSSKTAFKPGYSSSRVLSGNFRPPHQGAEGDTGLKPDVGKKELTWPGRGAWDLLKSRETITKNGHVDLLVALLGVEGARRVGKKV